MTDEPLICLIDDDVTVLKAVSRLLGTHGYAVQSFFSARQFLKRPATADDEIGCLVVDVHLPGMSGLELQDELAVAGRDLPMIFVTGSGDDRLRQRAIAGGAIDFLEKPFADIDLIRAVRQAFVCRGDRRPLRSYQ